MGANARRLAIISLFTVMALAPLWGQHRQFELPTSGASIAGVQLKQGRYQLKLSDNPGHEAVVSRRGREIITVPIEVRPIREGEGKNTVLLGADKTVKAIRFDSEVVLFVR